MMAAGLLAPLLTLLVAEQSACRADAEALAEAEQEAEGPVEEADEAGWWWWWWWWCVGDAEREREEFSMKNCHELSLLGLRAFLTIFCLQFILGDGCPFSFFFLRFLGGCPCERHGWRGRVSR